MGTPTEERFTYSLMALPLSTAEVIEEERRLFKRVFFLVFFFFFFFRLLATANEIVFG